MFENRRKSLAPPALDGTGKKDAAAGTTLTGLHRVLASYSWHSFRRDLIAGLTVAAVAVPQAMAYAVIAGVDPHYGLYTAVVMTALGSLFGSSSHLINGPTNAIALVVFSAIAGLGQLTAVQKSEAVFFLALLVGGIQIVIALCKLGDLTRYVSESVILGFMTGAGILVGLSQVPNLLGLRNLGTGHQHLLHRIWQSLIGNPVQPVAVAIGLGTTILVVGLRRIDRRWNFPLPDMLIALVLASVAAALCGWKENWPQFEAGLPDLHIPVIEADWIRGLSGSASAIALLGLLEALAIAKSIAARTRQPLDYNRQCLAEGLANLGGGLFQCIPGSGSLSRSAINYQAGAYSRVSGILAAAAVAVVILTFAPLAKYVPKPALAGILMVTAWRLIDRARLVYCFKATSYDASIALATAGFAVLLNIEYSILFGTFLSFLMYIPRAARLQASELTLTANRVLRERLPDDPLCSKLVILSLEGELFFGAAPELEEYFGQLTRRVDEGARVIVLRVKRTRNPDMVCLELLQNFLQEMRSRKVEVLLCGVREDFARVLRNLGFQEWLPADCVFLEELSVFSSTLKAVRRAYEILGNDLCPTCPRRQEKPAEKDDGYYMI